MKEKKEILERLQKCNQERVQLYLDVLDKIFIRAMVAKILDKESIDEILNFWKTRMLEEIDVESTNRTNFLMDTTLGRILSNKKGFDDGESVRLSSLEAMDVAKDIAERDFLSED